MDKLIVEGGRPLEGTIRISGAKNGALPLLASTLLAEGRCVLQNVPDLKDLRTLAEILREVGMTVEEASMPNRPRYDAPGPPVSPSPRLRTKVRSSCQEGVASEKRASGTFVTRVVSEENSVARYELVSQMRASIYLLGPLLAKRGYARVSLPGGCVIGLRPVDLHIKGLRALGAEIELDHGYIVARAPKGRLQGARVFLGGPMGSSVGATCNTLMAASLADGKTTIEGAACEPEVGELARFLNRMGATIEGIDTPRLVITGVPRLRGARAVVPSDRIEAGTYMIAAAATGGDVRLEEVPLDHLGAFCDKLRQAGVEITEEDDGAVRVRRTGPLKPVNMTTLTYPGYPTDLQAQLVAMLTLADGISVVTEKIYPDRFMHLAELNRMGADIHKQASSAIIRGVDRLSGTDVMASDLRAGAALVIAGLVASGQTVVHRVYHIDRGYERIEQKLTACGANIRRETTSQAVARAA